MPNTAGLRPCCIRLKGDGCNCVLIVAKTEIELAEDDVGLVVAAGPALPQARPALLLSSDR
jgi:hypothetical protein